MLDLTKAKHLMGIEEPDVLREYYDIYSNAGVRKLDEETLSRVITKHGQNGFVILSANRSDKGGEENNVATRKLITDLKATSYSYLPVYGGYHGTDGVVDSYEPSFIVFNYDRKGKATDFADLKLFAILMCGKYNQDSVLIKEPNGKPYYADRNGDIVGRATDDSVELNNPNAEYYTSLIKTNTLDYKNPDRLKRFTYPMTFDCYGNPNPATINELRRRKEGNGEIIINFGEKDC